jgi:hypothetical protein
MAELQSQFLKFHEVIKTDFENNNELRERRDRLLKRLQDELKKAHPDNTLSFSFIDQGSYDLKTGVHPLRDEHYDIDTGILFNTLRDTYEPVALKQEVYKILNTLYEGNVEMKKPCLRINFNTTESPPYHIDLAIYTREKNTDNASDNTLFLAKGYPGISKEKQIWEESEPCRLRQELNKKFPDALDREQFVRMVRYLKRWKDFNFKSSGLGKPSGIALTACCYNLFYPVKRLAYNTYTKQYSYTYNDLEALLLLVDNIINTFSRSNKISVHLPVTPYNNLFEKMNHSQMIVFKALLINLKNQLEQALEDTQTVNASLLLKRVFGDEFPCC